MRCPRCGNDNPATNRFCGMCGATLLQAEPAGKVDIPAAPARPSLVPGGQAPTPSAPAVSSQGASPTSSSNRAATPFSEDIREPISSEVPAISGPSFLGLNDPAPAKRRRGGLSIDPGAPGSRSLDYLLEDEDEPKSGGAWKFVLFVIALGLAVGFGYLRWKNQALPPWLGLSAHKPAAVSGSDAPDSNSAGGTNAPSTATSSSSAPATSPTDAGPAAPSAAPNSGNGSAASPSANPATTPAPATPQSSTPSQPRGTNAAAPPAQASPTPASSTAANSTPTNSTPTSGDAADPGNASGTGAASNPVGAADTAQPDSVPAKPAPKPHPAVAPVKVDQVAEARKYLYGQGAAQSCDRGLHLLKPLADQSNPKAMIEMGALYSAGLCTPRDLPTAYRWFALALRKDPANQPLQADLQKLWGEMTQPERQLAIKLSQ